MFRWKPSILPHVNARPSPTPLQRHGPLPSIGSLRYALWWLWHCGRAWGRHGPHAWATLAVREGEQAKEAMWIITIYLWIIYIIYIISYNIESRMRGDSLVKDLAASLWGLLSNTIMDMSILLREKVTCSFAVPNSCLAIVFQFLILPRPALRIAIYGDHLVSHSLSWMGGGKTPTITRWTRSKAALSSWESSTLVPCQKSAPAKSREISSQCFL